MNKNRTDLNYTAWHVVTGKHMTIKLFFIIAGHTCCLVDGCFGSVKRKYRLTCSLSTNWKMLNDKAACNVAQLGATLSYYMICSYTLDNFLSISPLC